MLVRGQLHILGTGTRSDFRFSAFEFPRVTESIGDGAGDELQFRAPVYRNSERKNAETHFGALCWSGHVVKVVVEVV